MSWKEKDHLFSHLSAPSTEFTIILTAKIPPQTLQYEPHRWQRSFVFLAVLLAVRLNKNPLHTNRFQKYWYRGTRKMSNRTRLDAIPASLTLSPSFAVAMVEEEPNWTSSQTAGSSQILRSENYTWGKNKKDE
jgi:hypothetical protein